MDTKHCPRCDTTKPVGDFYLNRGRSDGLSGYCVECQRAAENDRAKRAREELIEELGGHCVRCGFDDARALQIDHVNGDGAIDRIEFKNSCNAGFYRKVRENPDRYALMCANCNWIKRAEQQEVVGRRIYVRTEPTERQESGGRWSQEANAKRGAARRRWAQDHPDAEAQRGEKLRSRVTGRKMVLGSDGNRHWSYPGDPDYPVTL